jgi:hypothetical protein
MEFILNPIYFDDTPIVFFYGAAYDNICGIGINLKITTDHTVKAHFAGGNGNNMKVELLGIWEYGDSWRFQGHYRLDKFKIQLEPIYLKKILEGQDKKFKGQI